MGLQDSKYWLVTEFYEYGKEFSSPIISGEYFEQTIDYQVVNRPLHY